MAAQKILSELKKSRAGKKYALGLTTVEPHGGRGVVDGDRPLLELGSTGSDRLEARVDTKGTIRVGQVGAWRSESRLGDSVVLRDAVMERINLSPSETKESYAQLEGDRVTVSSRDLAGAVRQSSIGTDQDDVVGLGEGSTDEGKGSKDSGEAHLVL